MNEESAFDSRRPDRLTIYRAKVFPERPLEPLRLELQRDMKVTNKLFIMLHSIDGLDQERELYITLKQATNLLIKVKHDFQAFVSELLTIKHRQVTIKNLSF